MRPLKCGRTIGLVDGAQELAALIIGASGSATDAQHPIDVRFGACGFAGFWGKLCSLKMPNPNFGLSMVGSCTFAPFSQKSSGSDTKFAARIRNMLILGLVCCLLNSFNN